MFKVIFSLDYEIHGNGDGDPHKLMIEPTWRLLRMLEKYNGILTVFADAAQILKFKEYYEKNGIDRFSYLKIIEQLKYCINNGHDVQLHIHSSYYNSDFNGQKWIQSWPEYNLASLDNKHIDYFIKSGKHLLETILADYKPGYICHVFRAANWSMQPSKNIIEALVSNGFNIDSSVYKWGKQKGNVNYDYSNAFHHIFPYPICKDSIINYCKDSPIFEVPIYCEQKYFYSFFSFIRVFRVIRSLFHQHEMTNVVRIKKSKKKILPDLCIHVNKFYELIFSKHPRKLDLNQLSARQQISILKRIQTTYINHSLDVPIVFIGHSKSYIKYNDRVLEKTLKYLSKHKEFIYSTYEEIELGSYRNFYDK